MLSKLKDADVLVTGGNGFIGSHLVRRLIETGARVHVFSLHDNNIIDIKDKIDFHRVDIRDYDKVKENIKKVSPVKIFHLAANVNLSKEINDTEDIIRTKIDGTINIIRSLESADFDCFINTGTCEEYGTNRPPFDEGMMPMPITPYSSANAFVTLYCKMLHESNGLPVTTLRLFTCYGPGQKPNMLIPYVIRTALDKKDIKLTEGRQKRDLNFVEDSVGAYIAASQEKKAIGEIINIGTGKSYEIREVVNMILKLMGQPAKPLFGAIAYRKPEIWNLVADNSKAKRVLGWEPKTDIVAGLKKTIEWYKNANP